MPSTTNKETKYRQTYNMRRTLLGNTIVDHAYVVWAPPVGAAPTTSSFSTEPLGSMDWAEATARRDQNHFSFGFGAPDIKDFTMVTVTSARGALIMNEQITHFEAATKTDFNVDYE